MKQTALYLTLFMLTTLLLSCSKEDDPKSWDQSLLLGKWEQTGGSNFIACPDGNNKWIEFTESDYTMTFINDEGCATGLPMTIEYQFDGRFITTEFVNYEIYKLNETTFEGKITEVGIGGGKVIFQKVTK